LRVAAIRAAHRRGPLARFSSSPPMALAGADRGRSPGLESRQGNPVRERAARRLSLRMDGGRGLAPRAPRWHATARLSHGRHGYAWALDSAGLVGRAVGEGVGSPAVRLDRRGRGGSCGVSGAPGPSDPHGRADRHPFCTPAAGNRMTTDRLVTPFHAFRAQSGPRKVSPLNFSGRSESIQRLCAARPSDLWSRGRA
jgi:hypothetical protein